MSGVVIFSTAQRDTWDIHWCSFVDVAELPLNPICILGWYTSVEELRGWDLHYFNYMKVNIAYMKYSLWTKLDLLPHLLMQMRNTHALLECFRIIQAIGKLIFIYYYMSVATVATVWDWRFRLRFRLQWRTQIVKVSNSNHQGKPLPSERR